jgi:uncharacterized protein (TIGR02284 family)
METTDLDSAVERIPKKEKRLPAEGVTNRVATASPSAVRAALNRVIVAGRGEIMALEAAARILSDSERRERVREQAQRRRVFERDLATAVTGLGGVPAARAAIGASVGAVARRIQELFMGQHTGDAYAVCARATETTATAYAKALTLRLPTDVAFGLARQHAEVEWDRAELRRLRWGASLSPLGRPSPQDNTELPGADSPSELDDARAREVWSNEGGPGAGGRTRARSAADAGGGAY